MAGCGGGGPGPFKYYLHPRILYITLGRLLSMYCPMCATEGQGGNFCPKCGSNLPQTWPQPAGGAAVAQPRASYPNYYPPVSSSQSRPERNWAIASLVLGIASFIILPIIFSPAGVIFGAVSLSKRSEGNTLAYVGIILSLLGIVASVVVNGILLS